MELQERMTTGTSKVDRERGIIRDVKILGMHSKNNRRYSESAMRGAVHLYEGAAVNVNHPDGGSRGPRAYQDRIAMLRNVKYRDKGLYGDLQVNKGHELAESLFYAAEFMPDSCGLSHNIHGKTRQDGRTLVIESIDRVVSVDLVADAATVGGLFESHNPPTRETVLAEFVAAGVPRWLLVEGKEPYSLQAALATSDPAERAAIVAKYAAMICELKEELNAKPVPVAAASGSGFSFLNGRGHLNGKANGHTPRNRWSY